MDNKKTTGPANGMSVKQAYVEDSIREPQILAQIGLLHDAVQFLDEQVTNLEHRLSHVSVSEPPCDICEKQPPLCLVPMAEEIYSHRSRVNRANERIGSLLNRLEL